MCKCDDLSSTRADCEWVSVAEIKAIKDEAMAEGVTKTRAKKLLKPISRHPVETVFERGVPLGDIVHGINLICPPEVLHVIGVADWQSTL